MGGWAVDDRSPLRFSSNLSIQVDGVGFAGQSGGTITFNLPRPDVCNAYPGRPGCPNVGWSYALDTTLVPDGPHILSVAAYGTSTQSVSTNINVANGNSVIPKIKVYIDEPNTNSPTLQGLIRTSGWIIATDPSLRFQPYISIAVDNVAVASVLPTSQSRPDVCAVFTTALNCPVVGWTSVIDTTQFTDGPHMLTVGPSTFGTPPAFASIPITLSNSVVFNPMHLTIDGSASGNLSGTATLRGWAVSDDASIATVAVAVDGAAVGNASYGDSRNDVCAIYQNRVGCPNVGWSLAVDTTKLSNASHTVSVTATSSLGEQTTQTATVTVKN